MRRSAIAGLGSETSQQVRISRWNGVGSVLRVGGVPPPPGDRGRAGHPNEQILRIQRETSRTNHGASRRSASAPQLLVLIVTAEPRMRTCFGTLLRCNGYATLEAANGEQALSQAVLHAPDLVLLDSAVPDWTGKAVTAALAASQRAPVIAVAAREREDERIELLDAGASDCVDGAVSGSVLLARIRAVLRRNDPASADERAFVNGWRVNLITHEVIVDDSSVKLTPREFGIFSILACHAGEIVPYRKLLSEVWGAEQSRDLAPLRVHVQQLRGKLEVEPRRPRFLLTAPRVGYCFEPGRAM